MPQSSQLLEEIARNLGRLEAELEVDSPSRALLRECRQTLGRVLAMPERLTAYGPFPHPEGLPVLVESALRKVLREERIGAERLLTLSQTAEQVGLSPSTLRKAIRTGRLKAKRFGRSVRLSLNDVRAAFEAQSGTDYKDVEREADQIVRAGRNP